MAETGKDFIMRGMGKERGAQNTYRSERGGTVFFGCEHQHRETERRGSEHFDEHALGEIDVRRGNRAGQASDLTDMC
jgi:hypothetical protein